MKKDNLIKKVKGLKIPLFALFMIVLMSFSAKAFGDENWTLLKSEGGIEVYVKSEVCGKAPMYVFKIENKSNSTAVVAYTFTINDPSFGPATGEVSIAASSNVEGTCDDVYILSLPNHQRGEANLKQLIDVKLTKK